MFPQARFQADHCHTVQNIWKKLQASLFSYRRQIKSHGAATKDETFIELAKTLWKGRWPLLKEPANVSRKEKQSMAEPEREEEGFGRSFRNLLRPLGHIFAHSHREAPAKLRLPQLRTDIEAVADKNLEKILTVFDHHWDEARRSLRKKGLGTHRRGANSESGMRLLRRLEKNHDGIWSAQTRQHYIRISQAMKYLSLDIAEFIEKGPQTTGPPCVEKAGHTRICAFSRSATISD